MWNPANICKAYASDTRGNFAMMMSGAVMLVMLGVGAAIDFNGMASAKSKYQSLADMAVLAAAASGEEAPGILKQIAVDTVNDNNFDGDTISTDLTVTEENYIHVVVSGNYEMTVMSLFGKTDAPVSSFAEAPPKGDAKINLAMVLDVTDSMEGAKVAALRTAATDLVDNLTSEEGSETMISVVPFSDYIRIPQSLTNEPWLEKEPSVDACWNELDIEASTGCSTVGTGEAATTVCTGEVYTEVCNFLEWRGCMGSRHEPWNTRHEFGGHRLQGFAARGWCASELLPLTTDMNAVVSHINALDTDRDTYIPSGLVWGWRTLMPQAPFTEANTPDRHERKNALLLMTDGENTRSLGGTADSFNGVYHWWDDEADANEVTLDLCTSIKAENIVVYTVAFNVTDSETITMLRSCATDANKFFDADNAAELELAFETVGDELAQVRLSR